MTTISITRGTADVIREITKELKRMNDLKEVELRLKYGDESFSKKYDEVRFKGW